MADIKTGKIDTFECIMAWKPLILMEKKACILLVKVIITEWILTQLIKLVSKIFFGVCGTLEGNRAFSATKSWGDELKLFWNCCFIDEGLVTTVRTNVVIREVIGLQFNCGKVMK